MRAIRKIAEQAGLRMEFPAEVLREAEQWVDSPGVDDPLLTDLGDLPFVTIDNDDSKDLDQALHIAATPDDNGGGYTVRYALADAAYFVRPGTALFSEAVERGASFYLPGFSVPMLPRSLSEGICSLNEGQQRRALVVEVSVGKDGVVRTAVLYRARIRSRAKLTYAGVQAYFDASAGSPLANQPFTDSLDRLRELGGCRIALAAERDVVRYDRVQVVLEPDGDRLLARGKQRNDVERYNEQISLLCNIQGALFLTRRVDPSTGLCGVFRVHPPPDPDKLELLRQTIGDIVDAHGLPDSLRWQQQPEPESLADYVARLPTSRVAQAVQRQALLINQPSSFSMAPGPHYGIGAAAYARFSAPMREMIGVMTHQMAFDQMAQASSFPRSLVESVVNRANAAKKIQKQVTNGAHKLALDHLFSGDLELDRNDRPVRTGTVMGVSSRVYVQLDRPPLRVKLYERLDVRVGDSIAIVVADYVSRSGRWVFDVT